MSEKRSWNLDFKEAFKNSTELYKFLEWKEDAGVKPVEEVYPLFIPKPLAVKIRAQGSDGVLARQFLPRTEELSPTMNQGGLEDPIGDEAFNKAPQLIHRYPSRALFAPTTVCPVHCRYCFRKNELNSLNEIFQPEFEVTKEYLRNHPEISEIIFTGGDPLTLSNEKLKRYLDEFSEIQTIKDIRFHTRYPVILPSRIDEGFLEVINEAASRFRTVSLAIHTNHVSEFDEDAIESIKKLASTKIQLLSQTVLLKGVNDSEKDLLDLMNLLLDLKIRPYYLHHPDRVKGGMNFYLPLETGRSLYAKMRKNLPGWALPQYIIDVPGGHGKISAFNPETLSFSGKILGLDGTIISLEEPVIY